MLLKLKIGLKRVTQIFNKIVSNTKFFYFAVLILISQSLWYILTFRTMQFDEAFHFNFISVYAQRLNPIISSQNIEWDVLGDVTRYPSYMFHYLMSWPLKFIDIFTDQTSVKLIFLRILCLLFFISGLFLYRKVLRTVGASSAISNLTLLFIVLTPNVSILAGTVNYDNLIFPLSALILLLAIRIIEREQPKKLGLYLSLMLIISLVTALIKFTFLAFFTPIFIFVFIDLWRNEGKQIFTMIYKSFLTLEMSLKIVLIATMLLSIALIIERPARNIILYGEPKPTCQTILSQERCSQNFVASRNADLLKNKPTGFKPNPPIWYSGVWLEGMTFTSLKIVQSRQSPLLLSLMYIIFVPFGIVLILVCLRDLLKNKVNKLLIFSSGFYIATLFSYNYLLYVKYAQPIATNGRYLLPIAPIFLYFVAKSVIILFSQYKTAITVTTLVIIMCLTQGGGLTTYVLSTGESTYWQNSLIIRINSNIKMVLRKVVIERPIFSK